MKGIYILYSKIRRNAPNGIETKIINQIDCFQFNDLCCSECVQHDIRDSLPDILTKIITALPFTNVSPTWTYHDAIDESDFMYLRRPYFMTYAMRKFFEEVRRRNTNIKIIMEIPTYPYDLEYNTFKSRLFLLKDKFNRTKLKGLIDRFVVISDYEIKQLWNVPVISIKNGYAVNSVKPRKKTSDDTTIHLGCIAMFMPWHGYERLLNGLIDYYQRGGNQNIVIHFAGEGEELLKYKEISKHPLLENKVVFHGMLTGDDLDILYDMLDFGVISLAIYKIDSQRTSALKSREYLARGLPLISGSEVDILSENSNMPYYLQFPNDSSNIDIDKIIDFYYSKIISENQDDITNYIRNYAKSTIDMNLTFKPVIDYIKS